MTSAVEEADLFDDVEITEIYDINMQNGDEYVFIPSDNETEDTAEVESMARDLLHINVLNADPDHHHLAGVAGTAGCSKSTSRKKPPSTNGDAFRIVKNIDLTRDDDQRKRTANNHMFTVSYDVDISTQDLFNDDNSPVKASQSMGLDVDMMTSEVDIGETKVEPRDYISEAEIIVLEDDNHYACSEVIGVDSDDADASDNEKESVLQSLLYQTPEEDETATEERGPIANDHSYTVVDDAKRSKTPDGDLAALIGLSYRLAEKTSITAEEKLDTIGDIERIIHTLKVSASQSDSRALTEGADGTEVLPSTSSLGRTTAGSSTERKLSNGTDTLSLNLAENCSERLEFHLDGIVYTGSEKSCTLSETDTRKALYGSCSSKDTEAGIGLSIDLSENCSEPLEFNIAENPCMTSQKSNTISDTDVRNVLLASSQSMEAVDSRRKQTINGIKDFLKLGKIFLAEWELWLNKSNNNRQLLEGHWTELENEAEMTTTINLMEKINENMQRMYAKMPPNSLRKEMSIQTEELNRQLTPEKEQALNEKYKRRLLGSERTEGRSSDSSDSASSYTSDYTTSSEEEDYTAFERRRKRRKLMQKSAKSKDADQEQSKDDSDFVSDVGGKRKSGRILSSDSDADADEEGNGVDASPSSASQSILAQSLAQSSSSMDGHDDISRRLELDAEFPATTKIDSTGDSEFGGSNNKGRAPPMDVSDADGLSDGLEKDRHETEENILEDVLGEVDDILLDVDDILPAAEGVVQDYLVEEEVRTQLEEEVRTQLEEEEMIEESVNLLAACGTDNEKSEQHTSEQQSEPPHVNEKSEQHTILEKHKGTGTDKIASSSPSSDDDMSESELEEREIDRLCNLGNLDITRSLQSGGNVASAKPQDGKKAKKVVKKKDTVMDDILNEGETDLQHDSDDSDSTTAVLETEAQFLAKCNENMKDRLLNAFSSSDTDADAVSEDSTTERLPDGQQDSDDSAGSILMEKFLKSLHKDGEEESAKEEDDQQPKDETAVSKENVKLDTAGVKNDKEESVELIETKTKVVKADPKETGQSKKATTPMVDPTDKQLFSKKMFQDVDETLRKDREDERGLGKENGSTTSRSERVFASDDSDVELLDGPTAQSKRKPKDRNGKNFDFSAKARSGAVATKKKDPKEDDCISLSSDSDAEAEVVPSENGEQDANKSRKIRALITNDDLAEETKKAQKEEEARMSRLKKKGEQLKKFLTTFKPGEEESDLVLDYDNKRKEVVCVHPEIVKLLKPHQIEGIKFMYDNTYGTVDSIAKDPGSGCILAHCMGLGKTLQMITLLHTVMRYPQLGTKRVLVICPKSTVMNWSDEIQRWLGSVKNGPRLKVFSFPDSCDVNDKIRVLQSWFSSTAARCGCMLIGYEAFRILVNYERRKRSASNHLAAKVSFVKKKVEEYLLDPGADLVICDEGHQIKNKRSAISEAVSQIKTRRRIVLTGTPIQNNLKEYYCMVNFIKPSFLGSDREFNNLYANPIKNGQHKDSDQRAIKVMKQRSYVLHNKLSRFVQRREAGVLKEFLPEKYEYVLFVPLTPVQEKMYEVFLQVNEYTSSGDTANEAAKGKKFKLIADYTSLRKIWTHPKVLEKAWESAVLDKNKREARMRQTSTPDSDDDRPDDYNDISSGQLSVTNDWWRKYLDTHDLESLYPSNKLKVMFEILKQCEERGEKCLIFSAFVAVLNVVEHFMSKIHNSEKDQCADIYGYSAFKGPWVPGKDYYRLDGKTQKTDRHGMIKSFNDPSNKRTKCFLISAKAGGQGINLIGANRVIILDTSWNPSNDQQNIFRIFRLGQRRKCYVYRLLAMGTMEEKVYSRSVTKQALSFRVVDEQQIDRHYSYGELAELYTLSKVSDQIRETPILPADDLLASLLRNFPELIFKYHEHDSLLENKPEQDLSEEEKKEAWAAYEREIQNNERPTHLNNIPMMTGLMGQPNYGAGLSMTPYGTPMGYAQMSALADMYRNNVGYGSAINRYYSGQYAMVNDPVYASMLAKSYSGIPGFPMPGAPGIPDYVMPPGALNGSASATTNAYESNSAYSNFINLYSKAANQYASMAATLPGTTTANNIPTAGPGPVSLFSNQYNLLKQLGEYPPPPPHASGSINSAISVPHSSPKFAGPASQSSSASNATLMNMLNDQPMPMSSAAASGPFSHLNSPLLSSGILPSRTMTSAASTNVTPVAMPTTSTSFSAMPPPAGSKLQAPTTASKSPPKPNDLSPQLRTSPNSSTAKPDPKSVQNPFADPKLHQSPISNTAKTDPKAIHPLVDPKQHSLPVSGMAKSDPKSLVSPCAVGADPKPSQQQVSSATSVITATPSLVNSSKPPMASAASTSAVVNKDSDEVDDDGIPRPHIIVRDPSSINSGSAKPEKEPVAKKANIGIVYPEPQPSKQQQPNPKDIMLHAKSITTLTKPTIAVKNVESMKANSVTKTVNAKQQPSAKLPPVASGQQIKSNSPVPARSAPVTLNKPRSLPTQQQYVAPPNTELYKVRGPSLQRSTLTNLTGIKRSRPPTQTSPLRLQMPRSDNSGTQVAANPAPSPVINPKPSPTRQQVPVITNTKSLVTGTMQQPLAANAANFSNTVQPRNTTQSAQPMTNVSNVTLSRNPTTTVIASVANLSPITATSTTATSTVASEQIQQVDQLQLPLVKNTRPRVSTFSPNGNGVLANKARKVTTDTATAKVELIKAATVTNMAKQATGTVTNLVTSATVVGNPLSFTNTQTSAMAPSKPSAMINRLVKAINPNVTSPMLENISITKVNVAAQRMPISATSTSPTTVATSTASTATGAVASGQPQSNLAAPFVGANRKDLVITKATASPTIRRLASGSPHVPMKVGVTDKKPFTSPATPTTAVKNIFSAAGKTVVAAHSNAVGFQPETNSAIIRKRKADTLLDHLKTKNNSITISEVRSNYQPSPPKKANEGSPSLAAARRLGSGITITPKKPPGGSNANVIEVVEIE